MFVVQGLTVQRFEFVSRQLSGRYCCVSVGDCYVAAAFHEVPQVKKGWWYLPIIEGVGGGGGLCCLCKSRFINNLGEVNLDVKFEKLSYLLFPRSKKLYVTLAKSIYQISSSRTFWWAHVIRNILGYSLFCNRNQCGVPFRDSFKRRYFKR